MALYVSDSANLRIKVRGEERIYTPKGDLAMVKPKIVAQFSRGGVPSWAVDFVDKHLEWRGQDDSFSKSIRTGVFDTVEAQKQHHWTDEERLDVEAFLDGHTAGNNFIRVEPPRIEAPWPSITQLTVTGRRTPEAVADKLIATADEIGVDVERVLLFVAQEAGNVTGWDQRLIDLVREKASRTDAEQSADEEIVAA